MIWNPKVGQMVRINYKDKSMICQGRKGKVVAVGRGVKNTLVEFSFADDLFKVFVVIPRGNLNYL